ncbi:MAG TPA: hypothetical protein VFM08_13425 [Nocardioides sp.]|nr:hypothetical protein [Nocardioides sp.]
MNDVSWGALALALTALGGIYTWWALRHRGFASAVRAAGITLLPLAAWMTGLLEVFGDITDVLTHWLAHLVFSPLVWLGMIVFVVAFVLIGAANFVTRRQDPTSKSARSSKRERGKPKSVSPTSRPDPLIDDEMAEIQAILKKRGIS